MFRTSLRRLSRQFTYNPEWFEDEEEEEDDWDIARYRKQKEDEDLAAEYLALLRDIGYTKDVSLIKFL